MFKKWLNYFLWAIAVTLLAFNSIYIKDLSEMKAAETKPFNARQYAQEYLYTKLPSTFNKSVEVSRLYDLIKRDTSGSFEKYGYSQNNADVGNFLVSGEGTVQNIEEDNVLIKLNTDVEIKLATEYIFGNTVRDAAGLVSVDEFNNSMDINNVSEEINRLIKTEVVKPFKAKVKVGDKVQFFGCVELSQADLKLDDLNIIPVSLTIKN